jgi:glutamate carboxypeptidase
MDPILAHIRLKQKQLVLFLRQLVECESPSDSPADIRKCNDLIASHVADIAKCRRVRNHLLVEFRLPGPKQKDDGQILGLGHSDTVWPLGTLKSMPWREQKGRLWGPGVLDMKAGLAFFIFAARALREMDVPVQRKVILQVNADEEVGSDDSRELTESLAKESAAVLVLEPGTGLTGKAKTARKGIGGYRVMVTGRASHAGVDFEMGASAILELARQIAKIERFTDLKSGITVNPGVIGGGTRSNVVAAEAYTDVDMRIAKLPQARELERKFRGLRVFDKRCAVAVEGGLNRPPMERSADIVKLFKLAKRLAAQLNVALEESSTGGGSDGNFTAALGIPTLDGVGAVGEGAHAAHESILIDRIADRTALLAKLVAAI